MHFTNMMINQDKLRKAMTNYVIQNEVKLIDFAKKIGVSPSTISFYFSGKRNVAHWRFAHICKQLKLRQKDFLIKEGK